MKKYIKWHDSMIQNLPNFIIMTKNFSLRLYGNWYNIRFYTLFLWLLLCSKFLIIHTISTSNMYQFLHQILGIFNIFFSFYLIILIPSLSSSSPTPHMSFVQNPKWVLRLLPHLLINLRLVQIQLLQLVECFIRFKRF